MNWEARAVPLCQRRVVHIGLACQVVALDLRLEIGRKWLVSKNLRPDRHSHNLKSQISNLKSQGGFNCGEKRRSSTNSRNSRAWV